MKRSITVLGIEAEGIRGVRLEENGAEWLCVDREFWAIGTRHVEDDIGKAASPQASADGEVRRVEDNAPYQGGELSAEERYLATVDALKDAAKRFGANEVVLSMPLSALLVKVMRTPVEDRDALAETAGTELGKVSPFPDETPVAGIETVSETDSELVTMFAALPESVAADIGDALDEAKVRVLRTDITALGWLRTLWSKIVAGKRVEDNAPCLDDDGKADSPEVSASRTVVLMDLDDGWDVVVLDDGTPSLLRGLGAVSDPAELGRELTLSLLQSGMNADIGEIVVFSERDIGDGILERLKMFAPVRVERVDRAVGGGDDEFERGVDGVARRTVEGATLDVTPADWTELREEARFSKKLKMFLSVAAAGWVIVMGALFGGPIVYDQLTEHQKSICKSHAKAHRAVKEMRDKVELVQQYSDHARGTLEMLKAVSDRLPEGVTLTSFNYRRGEKLSLVGEADQPTVVYDFKNALTDAVIIMESGAEDEEGEGEITEKLFAEVTLTGPSKSRDTHRFSIECLFEVTGEEEE